MGYPEKPSGTYKLRDYNFAQLDDKKIPIDEYLFKNGYKNADESEVESVPDAHEQNWLFDILHRNLRYTLDTAEENKKLLETKVATPTSIGQVKIGYGLSVTSNGVLSVQKDIAQDANIISYDLPVGSYMLWAGNQPPEYFIEPAGQTLLRSSYPELWQFAQDNKLVGTLFGNGDGKTSFTVTDIRGSFISIADSDEKVGKHTEAGLPNITGNLTYYANLSVADGAFFNSNRPAGRHSGGNGGGGSSGFDASRSNKVYGKSNTVTPENWGLKIILKALPTPPSNAVPIGTILDYTGGSAPDGYIIANGAELSRKTFSRLYQWAVANGLVKNQSEIPNTAHAFYGTGDGSTTFTIPNLRNSQIAGIGNNRPFGKSSPNGRALIKRVVSGATGYNIYSDGWCEQWGDIYSQGSVTFTKEYKDTNYRILLGTWCQYFEGGGISGKTTKGFSHRNGKGWGYNTEWMTCGYINLSAGDYDYSLPSETSVTYILKY